ncbi:MAG: hypothetical protein ACUVTM_04225 [Candidatus Bathyarchaeia archaeon]
MFTSRIGIYMSESDISTQQTLQQFSPYVVAMVLDPAGDEVGFYVSHTEDDSIQ